MTSLNFVELCFRIARAACLSSAATRGVFYRFLPRPTALPPHGTASCCSARDLDTVHSAQHTRLGVHLGSQGHRQLLAVLLPTGMRCFPTTGNQTEADIGGNDDCIEMGVRLSFSSLALSLPSSLPLPPSRKSRAIVVCGASDVLIPRQTRHAIALCEAGPSAQCTAADADSGVCCRWKNKGCC